MVCFKLFLSTRRHPRKIFVPHTRAQLWGQFFSTWHALGLLRPIVTSSRRTVHEGSSCSFCSCCARRGLVSPSLCKWNLMAGEKMMLRVYLRDASAPLTGAHSSRKTIRLCRLGHPTRPIRSWMFSIPLCLRALILASSLHIKVS